jgi:hypothetical protein
VGIVSESPKTKTTSKKLEKEGSPMKAQKSIQAKSIYTYYRKSLRTKRGLRLATIFILLAAVVSVTLTALTFAQKHETTFTITAPAFNFVIGDNNAVVGSQVTFWGAQWAKLNSLSGGSASSSFKGFANSTSSDPATCGGTWTSDPGNSSGPPNAIPEYITVIVSSSVTQNGSVISGDNRKVVIVKTNPGYGPSPGQAGTGTVYSVVCQ